MEANRLSGSRAGFFDFIAVGLIVVYQKVISPLKGYSCAHRYRHGGLSCSEYVKQAVLRNGGASAYPDIRSRFQACKSAARDIHRQAPKNQTGVLDCGLDGCGDVGSIDSCFGDGGGDGGSGSGKSSIVIVLPVGFFIILLIFAGLTWFKAPQVDAIEIRLIENQQEAQEKGIALLLGGKNPDYQVIFLVNGRKITTNTLPNSSAKSWLRLEPKSGFEIADLEQVTILNKQVLADIVLETIDNPKRQGSGEYYEYRLNED